MSAAFMLLTTCRSSAPSRQRRRIPTLCRCSQTYGHPRIPVLGPAGHVVGMITQVDLISGLYWHGVVKAPLHSCDVILCTAIQANTSLYDVLYLFALAGNP